MLGSPPGEEELTARAACRGLAGEGCAPAGGGGLSEEPARETRSRLQHRVPNSVAEAQEKRQIPVGVCPEGGGHFPQLETASATEGPCSRGEVLNRLGAKAQAFWAYEPALRRSMHGFLTALSRSPASLFIRSTNTQCVADTCTHTHGCVCAHMHVCV